MLTQAAGLVAVHEQPASLQTVTLPLPAFESKEALRAEIVNVQGAAAAKVVALATLE